MSVTGAPVFVDEKDIAPYFMTNVKFVAKHGFLMKSVITFAPKAFSTREDKLW